MASLKYKDADSSRRFRTTEEMLEELYIWDLIAREVVITNPNCISDRIERYSCKTDKCPVFRIQHENLRKICYEKAHEIYGDRLPEQVKRLSMS